MEAEIKKFLSGHGFGSYYCGIKTTLDGCGDEYGNGTVCGVGTEAGFGYGNGDVCGEGMDNGHGHGYSGYYNKNPNDLGQGSGYGYGNSFGGGYHDGDGDGSGYTTELNIEIFEGDKVYYVDMLPCIFKCVHNGLNWAEVKIIDPIIFSTRRAFIGKFKNVFAHANTIREALISAKIKYYRCLNIDSVKENLLAEFKAKNRLTVKELYIWHGALTGSCKFGRDEFQKSHHLNDNDTLSLEEFIELTKNDYGGEIIKNLLD